MTANPKSHSLKTKGLILSCSIVLAVLVTEGVLRLAEGRDGSFRVADATLHHALAPLQEQTETWGSNQNEHHSNSLGMRDSHCDVVPKEDPNHQRILFLGDSFTEGLGVAYTNTVPAVVEKILNDNAGPGLPVHCINGGLSSYSPLIELRLLRQLWDQGYKFDQVVLLIDTSDAQDELLYRHDLELPIDGTVEDTDLVKRPFYSDLQLWLYQSSAIVRKLWRTSRHFQPQWIWRDSMKQDREQWAADHELIERWGNRGVERLLDSLDLIVQETRARNVPLHVVIYPWPYQVTRATPGILEDRISRFCNDSAIPLVNLYPAFRDANDPDLFIAGDVHWSERGHELVGKLIAASMDSGYPSEHPHELAARPDSGVSRPTHQTASEVKQSLR